MVGRTIAPFWISGSASACNNACPLYSILPSFVLSQGSFDLHGAVAVGQASPGVHDLATALPVLPAACAGAPLLRQDLPPPETTQVTQLPFHFS